MTGCGGCTECCWYLGIEELAKAPCAPCKHVAEGCSIYPMRPRECAEFECVWLQMQRRPNPWPRRMRPDRCGVMFAFTTDENTLTAHMRNENDIEVHPARWFVRRLLLKGLKIIRIIGPRRTLIHFVPSEASGDLREEPHQA